MRYLVEMTERADKNISKLDNGIQENIKNKIRQLSKNPRKGKHLYKNFYELRAKNFRIYYELFRGIIVIEKIKYDGKVQVQKVGTKNTQKRDVRRMK